MKTKLIVAFFAIGLAWAAYDDMSKKDPEWIKDDCNEGLEHSVHQRNDATWVVCVKNSYVEEVKTFVRLKSPKEEHMQIEVLGPGETIEFDKLKDPEHTKVELGPTFGRGDSGEWNVIITCEKYINNK